MNPSIAKQLLGFLLIAMCNLGSAQEDYHQLADFWGLEPIDTLSLKGDDLELRFWSSGFGSKAYILSRRDGRWKAFHIGEDRETVMASLHGYRAAQVMPLCDLDGLFEQLKALGVERLEPARSPPKCKAADGEFCLDTITLDGWSAMVEFKTSRGLNTQSYRNPGIPHFASPDDDPMTYPTFRAGQIYWLLDHALGGRATSSIKPHSRSFSFPVIVLFRPTYAKGVKAFLVHDYDSNEQGGKAHYDSQYFQELPQGFAAIVHEDDNNEVRLNWTGYRRIEIGNEPEGFWLKRNGDQWQAYQSYDSAANTLSYEISVVQKHRFQDLTYVDLSSGFERELTERSAIHACRRITPLTAKRSARLPTQVQVESQNSDPLGWRVLPPILQSANIMIVRAHYEEFWIGVADDHAYQTNQSLMVTHQQFPPPPGSDKPVVLTVPVQEPSD